MAAEKLDNKLLSMLTDLQHLQSKEDHRHKEECHATKACLVIHAHFYCLKKVYKQVHLKELYLVKQGLYKLKAKEAKMDFSLTGEQTAYTPVVDLSVSSPPKVH